MTNHEYQESVNCMIEDLLKILDMESPKIGISAIQYILIKAYKSNGYSLEILLKEFVRIWEYHNETGKPRKVEE